MSPAHLASVRIGAPAEFALDRLADPHALGRWALGSMDFRPVGEGLWERASLFDGTTSLVEIVAFPELGLIDYHVGSREARVPRVSVRVVKGADWGLSDRECMAALTTWRAGWMDDARWHRTQRTHEVEVLLFKAQIETAWQETGE